MKSLFTHALLCAGLSSALCAQSLPTSSFSELAGQAETLTALLENIDQANSEQQRRLADLDEALTQAENESRNLRQAIADLKSISDAQGEYVRTLLEEAKRQQAIYAAQLTYQKRLQWRSKILTVSLVAAVPVTAVVTALVTWKLAGR